MKWHEDSPSHFSILFFPPILPPFFLNHSADFFSTAEFHLYVNEGKRSHLEATSRPPSVFFFFFCPFLLSRLPPFYTNSIRPVTQKKSHADQYSLATITHTAQSKLWPRCPSSAEVQASSFSSPQPSLMAPACLLTPRQNGKHMLNWARCARGGWLSTKCCMLVVSQECLSLAHFGQSSPDSSFFLLVRPRAPRTDI